jgi:hypothetical protein
MPTRTLSRVNVPTTSDIGCLDHIASKGVTQLLPSLPFVAIAANESRSRGFRAFRIDLVRLMALAGNWPFVVAASSLSIFILQPMQHRLPRVIGGQLALSITLRGEFIY